MSIKTPPIQTIKDFSYSQRFVKGLASRSIAPLILLEAFVEGGRTYQAYQRGGFDEARERITEEMIGAAFWFSGVAGFNKLIDHFVGKRIMKLPETEFDVGKDAVRDPLANYLKKFDFKDIKTAEKKIAKFKFAKAISSIVLANCLVGFAVPKLNQAITNSLRKKRTTEEPKLTPQNQEQNKKSPKLDINTATAISANKHSMSNFLDKSKDKKEVAFKGISTQVLLDLANSFENTPKYQLLSTDVGIAGGRAICARNNHERTEVLFRDISSSYFYMFNMPIVAMMLNRMQDGKKTRLDPVAAQQTSDHLQEVLKANGGKMKVEEFEKAVLGNRSNKYKIFPELDEAISKNKGIIDVEDFINMIKGKVPDKEIANYKQLAEGMSKLQPQLAGRYILTKGQVKDIFTGGAINMPEFLQNIFRISTQDENLFTGKVHTPAFDNPLKFISSNTFDHKKGELLDYVNTVINKAKKSGNEVTSDLLNKVCKQNFTKNAFNWGIGFAISAAFLSTFIPKIQYYITKKITGHDQFPGTTDYSNEQKK